MANNQCVNKVEFGNQVVMDISDTTAEADNVLEGKKFYSASGAPTFGTFSPDKVINVTVTASSGIENALFARRYGHVVCVSGYLVSSNAAFGNNQLVASIEAGNWPIAVVRFPVEVANEAYEAGDIAFGAINSSGNIYITTKSGNTYRRCYFSVSYIAEL